MKKTCKRLIVMLVLSLSFGINVFPTFANNTDTVEWEDWNNVTTITLGNSDTSGTGYTYTANNGDTNAKLVLSDFDSVDTKFAYNGNFDRLDVELNGDSTVYSITSNKDSVFLNFVSNDDDSSLRIYTLGNRYSDIIINSGVYIVTEQVSFHTVLNVLEGGTLKAGAISSDYHSGGSNSYVTVAGTLNLDTSLNEYPASGLYVGKMKIASTGSVSSVGPYTTVIALNGDGDYLDAFVMEQGASLSVNSDNENTVVIQVLSYEELAADEVISIPEWALPEGTEITAIQSEDNRYGYTIAAIDKGSFDGSSLSDIGLSFPFIIDTKDPNFTITVNSTLGGTVFIDDEEVENEDTVSVSKLDTVLMKVYPDTGYSISSIIIDNVSVAIADGYSLSYAYDDSVVEVEFTKDPLSTTIEMDEINDCLAGSEITLHATVSPTATGSVEFFNGATSLGKASVVDGIATLVVTFNEAGNYAIDATFTSGDENEFSSSTTTKSVEFTVTEANTGDSGDSGDTSDDNTGSDSSDDSTGSDSSQDNTGSNSNTVVDTSDSNSMIIWSLLTITSMSTIYSLKKKRTLTK